MNKNLKSALVYLSILVGGFIVGNLVLFFLVKAQLNVHNEEEFHEHANIAFILNGERFDFSHSRFMNFEPCVAEKSSIFPTAYAHIDSEDLDGAVHLHNNDGDVIHVHQEGVTYHDFFTSLNMELTETKFVDHEGNVFENDEENEFRFFINGEEVEDFLEQEIRELDKALITFGAVDKPEVKINEELLLVPDNACITSGTCAQRGEVPYESCGGGGDAHNTWLLDLME